MEFEPSVLAGRSRRRGRNPENLVAEEDGLGCDELGVCLTLPQGSIVHAFKKVAPPSAIFQEVTSLEESWINMPVNLRNHNSNTPSKFEWPVYGLRVSRCP